MLALPESTIYQDAEAQKVYRLSWAEELEGTDTIASSVWTITPPDELTASSAAIAGKSTKVMLSGGIIGETYTVSNTITTSAGEKDRRSFSVKVTRRRIDRNALGSTLST